MFDLFGIEAIIALIPAALFIAFRVIEQSRKKRAAGDNRDLTTLMAAKIKEKPPAFTFVPAPEMPAEMAAARAGLVQTPPEPEKSPPRITRLFPENLEHLPPLMRAAVCADILGPPKGL